MKSTFLEDLGVKNFIAGKEYNFKSSSIKEKVIPYANKVISQMNVEAKEIYSAYQVHSSTVVYCSGMQGDGFYFGREIDEADGLITDKKGIVLMIKFADCTPIILYDKDKGILSALHSGWRGTAKGISKEAIDMMKRNFGSKIEDIYAYVGPSIDQGNYEVGKDVYDAFSHFDNRDYFFKPISNKKYLLSMTDANLSLLLSQGMNKNNIRVSKLSTYECQRLHSYRRDKPEYGVNAIFVVMD